MSNYPGAPPLKGTAGDAAASRVSPPDGFSTSRSLGGKVREKMPVHGGVRSARGEEATSPPLALALFEDSAVVRRAAFTQLPTPFTETACDMTEHNKPMDPKTVAAYKALDGRSVTVRTHELVEDDDGAPAGVKAAEWAPAYFHVPWGRHGFPSRAEVYGRGDVA